MILDVAHITISSKNLDFDIEVLKKLGYEIKFKEIKIKNPNIKKNLQKNFEPYHDLILLKKENNLDIELIDHHSINITEPYIIPIFENIPINFITSMNIDEKFGKKCKINGLNFPIFIKQEKNNSKIIFNELVIKTNTITESIKFWKKFGFVEKESKEKYSKMIFRSIVSNKKVIIHLMMNEKKKENFLDDSGPNCIAFLTHSAEKENYLFSQTKLRITNIDTLILNNKKIQVFFVIGPSNELVEIISVNTN